MAKYEITHSCGHKEVVQLFGPIAERQKKIKRMSAWPCAECQAKEANERDEKNGLPALVGSPKQITWASDIRAEKMEVIETGLKQLKQSAPEKVETVANYVNWLKSQNKAKWWIDNRNTSWHDLVNEFKISVSEL